MTERYLELPAASEFSFLEGASLPEDLIQRAAELNMPAMALLDRNGVYGAARFHTLARKHGVRAHVGAEIAVSSMGNRLMPPAWLPHHHVPEAARLPLLCTSRAGYQNLCQLITRFKMRETAKCEGAATLEDVEEYSSGLICLTGGDEGPVAAALMHGGESAAVTVTEQLIQIFGRQNVYVELQRHNEREEELRNQASIRIAHRLHFPLLATNGVRHATTYDREILDVFTAIRHHTDLEHAGRLLSVNGQRHLRNALEMTDRFSDLPHAIANTVALSERLEFELDDLGYEF